MNRTGSNMMKAQSRLCRLRPTSPNGAPQSRTGIASLLTSRAWEEIARALSLSARELEITQAILVNHKDTAIAGDLSISDHTVHKHLNRLFKKLRISTRTQLIVHIFEKLLLLTLSDSSALPPICRHRVNGRCPLAR